MVQKNTATSRPARKGFQRAASVLSSHIREVGETRGFAVTRLLTHWAEIVGAEIAGHTRPVEVSYGRQGFGATLTVLTTGAYAPMVEMQKEALLDKINACYGYAAISRIRITQTAATGFAEGQASFAPAPEAQRRLDPAASRKAADTVAPVSDTRLRDALAALGANVFSRKQS